MLPFLFLVMCIQGGMSPGVERTPSQAFPLREGLVELDWKQGDMRSKKGFPEEAISPGLLLRPACCRVKGQVVLN